MMNRTTTLASLLVAASSGTALAGTINFHVSGSEWGLWIIWDGLADDLGGSQHFAHMDGGSGVPMDFMINTPDGAFVDGADVTSRMFSADVTGNIGDAEVGLTDWSLWIGTSDISLHVIWSSAAGPLALNNLGSSGLDGVEYGASGFNETLDWTLERTDGTVETFSTSFDSFRFISPIPSPGALSLFGLGGLLAARRRR